MAYSSIDFDLFLAMLLGGSGESGAERGQARNDKEELHGEVAVELLLLLKGTKSDAVVNLLLLGMRS